MTAQPIPDVHAHTCAPGEAQKSKNRTDPEPNPARGAARARVIPLFGRKGQEATPKEDPPTINPQKPLGQQLWEELAGADQALADSDLAREPLTPYQALITVAPGKGEAGGAGIWVAMTLAGLIRLGGVSLGWLIAQGFATRIRAGVAGTIIALAVLLAALAGWQPQTN
jgi:hypothetical protein